MARAPPVQEIETTPEADRLEGFPHPRETSALIGQSHAARELADAFASGRLHHGWLLVGREGIGKATLAYRFAGFLLADAGEHRPAEGALEIARGSASTRQVRALSHPGLLVLRRFWDWRAKRFTASIPVDEVRRLRGFLGHTAGPAAWRVVIVDSADDLNTSAANALLKSLEEPPARTVFLVITSELGRLLPTIRSRCRILQLSPLGSDDLRRAATAAFAAADEPRSAAELSDRLIGLAEGSVRRMLVLAGSDGLSLHARIEAMLNGLPALDWSAAHGLADDLGSPGSQQRFEIFFDLLLDTLARTLRACASGARRPSAWAGRIVAEANLPAWAELWERIVRDKAEVAALNLDRRAFVLNTLSQLSAVARP